MKLAAAFVITLILFSHSYALDEGHLKAFGLDKFDEDAPPFTVMGMGDYKGKAVFLHFWATWCKPCKEELKTIENLYRRHKDSDLRMVVISIDNASEKEKVEGFANALGLTFPIYLADEGNVPGKYTAAGIPVTYLINRQGSIVARAMGARKWDEADPLIKALIEEERRQLR